MEAKYQYSIKLESGEIYVCHAESFEELQLAIEEIRVGLNRKEIDRVPINQELEKPVSDPAEEDYCLEHKVKMKARNGKHGVFYSHSKGVYPDLDWCSGHGFPDNG